MELAKLKAVKKSLIETKPPVEEDVRGHLEYLLSLLDLKDGTDKERVIYNDALSICLLRYHMFNSSLDGLNEIFDYCLTFINSNHSPLHNSLNVIIEKLLLFKNADVHPWIDMIMLQPMTKNLLVLLEKLFRKSDSTQYFVTKYPDFPQHAMAMFDNNNLANSISKTLVVVYKELRLQLKTTQAWYDLWISLMDLEDPVVRINLVTHLLPGLIAIDPDSFQLLVNHCKSNLDALVSILSMGQKKKFIASLEVIDQKSLMSCLVHSDAGIRADALLLVFGAKKEPLTRYAFDTVVKNHIIEINLNEATQQDKFISAMCLIISGKLLDSVNGKLGKESEVVSREYLDSLKSLLVTHLEPQNNFQQKTGAIMLLKQIQDKIESVFNERLVKLLVDNLFSNYKLIRELSLDLLLQCLDLSEVFSDHEVLEDKTFAILPRLAGRESEGAALAVTFLAKYHIEKSTLDHLMEKIYQGLGKETGEQGYLQALASVVNKLGVCGDFQRLLRAAKAATRKMTEILATERIAYADEQEFVKSKEVVNYSWKVIQAANDLFLALLQKLPNLHDVEECFLLVIDQLHRIKFRAAISSLYPSMIAMARLLYSLNPERIESYIKQELEYITTESKQLVTRRSGGLLYVIPSMLIASKDKNTSEFVFERLFEIADMPYESESKEDLPQVHAFNTLGQLFKEGQLTGDSLLYVERALFLSLEHFDAPNWSIRNCALMLFGHLERKIFSGSRVNSKRFFARFKKVEPIFVEYLINGQDQTVFPILIMLEQLEFTSSGSWELRDAVLKLLGRKSWKVREFAAKIIAHMLQPNEFEQFILSALDSKLLLNTLHGLLICLKCGVYKIDFPAERYMKLAFGDYFIANEYISILERMQYKDVSKLVPYFEELISERKDLDGGRQLFLESFVVYLLNNDKDNVLKYVELALQSQYGNVHDRVLEYVSTNAIACQTLIKNFIESHDFHYTTTKALKLYSSMDEITPLTLVDENQLGAFECSARFVDDNDREFYSKCFKLTETSEEIDTRIMGFNAIFTYLKRCTNKSGYLYSACLMLCFERGLFDDNEGTRQRANKCISEIINYGDVATTYLSYAFPSLVTSLVDQKYYDELVNEMILRNTLDTAKLDREFEESQDDSLYSFERDNFYKNEIVYSTLLSQFPIDANKVSGLQPKVQADIAYIREFRDKYTHEVEFIPRDYIHYDFVAKTRINARIVGLTNLDETLFALTFCKMG
ncbi:hypothetical protein Cantr_04551 [Candida viswanathii]|uniref:Uncharacterized protein n=1 Tax=Candida viswanathii TaxID=5486 RepID=A0A367XNB6_9ASCO|nr:hypothetical protein Cantr_04551 [Candida viswanathii]